MLLKFLFSEFCQCFKNISFDANMIFNYFYVLFISGDLSKWRYYKTFYLLFFIIFHFRILSSRYNSKLIYNYQSLSYHVLVSNLNVKYDTSQRSKHLRVEFDYSFISNYNMSSNTYYNIKQEGLIQQTQLQARFLFGNGNFFCVCTVLNSFES